MVKAVQARYPQTCSTTGPDGALVQATPEQCYRIVRQSISVDPLAENSDIIQVAARSPDPQKAQATLQAVSDAYLAYSLSSKQTDIRRGINFVDQKLPDIRDKVDNLQGQLQDVRLNNNIIDPDSQAPT